MRGFNLALVHNGLRGGEGIDLLEDLAQKEDKSPVILTTASMNAGLNQRMKALIGKVNFLHIPKPYTTLELIGSASLLSFPLNTEKYREAVSVLSR